MDTQYSILIYQRRGSSIDWCNEGYYGPFASPEEREEYARKYPPDSSDERYVVAYLTK